MAEFGSLSPEMSDDEGFAGLVRRLREATDPTWLVPQAGPVTGSIRDDLVGSLPLASLGLRPSGVHVWPTQNGGTRMQIRGRFASTNNPVTHPATELYPAIVSGQIAGNLYDPPYPAAEANAPAHHVPTNAELMVGRQEVPPRASFDDRFGQHATPIDLSSDMAMRSAPVDISQSAGGGKFEQTVPLPRPKPRFSSPPVRRQLPREEPDLLERLLKVIVPRG